MTPVAVRTANVLLPGSGLVLRGRLVAGLPILVAAMALVVLALAAALAPAPGFDGGFAVRAVIGYVLLGAIAGGTLWHWEQGARLDPAAVRELHRKLATAYLRGELPEARRQADLLVVAAGREPGAWSLLAMVAAAMGDAAVAARATKRAQVLAAELRN
jgi:hypothetical protein